MIGFFNREIFLLGGDFAYELGWPTKQPQKLLVNVSDNRQPAQAQKRVLQPLLKLMSRFHLVWVCFQQLYPAFCEAYRSESFQNRPEC